MIKEKACFYFSEKDLEEILFFMPKNHRLRKYLQKGGDNIFWRSK